MIEFNLCKHDLALEFKRSPYGRHSPGLQQLLNVMRRPSSNPYYVLWVEEVGVRWRLALLTPGGNAPPQALDAVFGTLEEAEWYVFRLRWEALGGEPLDPNLSE